MQSSVAHLRTRELKGNAEISYQHPPQLQLRELKPRERLPGRQGVPVQGLHLTLHSPSPPGLQSSKVSSWTKFYILIPRAILPDSTRGWAEMGAHLLFVVGTSRS